MEGHELLNRVNRVKAPPDFEECVLRKLGEVRRARDRRRAAYRYVFAGSAAALLIGFVLLNQNFLTRSGRQSYAGKDKAAPTALNLSYPSPARGSVPASYLPILETVDYSSEMRNASNQPRTVYILEQVSDVRPSEIKY